VDPAGHVPVFSAADPVDELPMLPVTVNSTSLGPAGTPWIATYALYRFTSFVLPTVTNWVVGDAVGVTVGVGVMVGVFVGDTEGVTVGVAVLVGVTVGVGV